MIGVIILIADFNSYGQPYPLLHELKATTIINATAIKVIFLEILVFMIYILKTKRLITQKYYLFVTYRHIFSCFNLSFTKF